jgi:uncharacterized protein YpmS
MVDPMFLVFLLIGSVVLVFVTIKVLQHRDEGAVSNRRDKKSNQPEDLSHSADSPQWHHDESRKAEKSQGE